MSVTTLRDSASLNEESRAAFAARLGVTVLALGLCGNCPRRPISELVAVGSSETVGFGVLPESTYPQLVAKRRRWALVIRAAIDVPALSQSAAGIAASDAVVLFVNFNDLFHLSRNLFRERIEAWARIMRRASFALIILPPPLALVKGVESIYGRTRGEAQSLEYERWHVLRSVARDFGIGVLELTRPQARDLLADGLHPSAGGHERIAALVAEQIDRCR